MGTMHALFAIPQLQCVLSFTTVCDVVSLQSGTSRVINATNQVKRVTGVVSYRNVLHLLSVTANGATWLSRRVLTQCWYCIGCVEIGRLSMSGCGYESAAW